MHILFFVTQNHNTYQHSHAFNIKLYNVNLDGGKVYIFCNKIAH